MQGVRLFIFDGNDVLEGSPGMLGQDRRLDRLVPGVGLQKDGYRAEPPDRVLGHHPVHPFELDLRPDFHVFLPFTTL